MPVIWTNAAVALGGVCVNEVDDSRNKDGAERRFLLTILNLGSGLGSDSSSMTRPHWNMVERCGNHVSCCTGLHVHRVTCTCVQGPLPPHRGLRTYCYVCPVKSACLTHVAYSGVIQGAPHHIWGAGSIWEGQSPLPSHVDVRC